jgi:lipoprotein-releasing system permease protein
VFPVIVLVFVLGAAALLLSLILFLGFSFERFVGLRYLLRARRSNVARSGLVITTAVTLLGLAALFGGRGHSRELETLGVMATLLGGLGLLLFALLRIFSVFTTVSTMGVVLGVASLVVVLAVTSGFEREFEEKVLAVNAHLLVMNYGEPGLEEREKAADGYMKKLQGLPGLRRMAKFSMSAGEVMIGNVGANLKGIDVATGGEELRRALIDGTVEDLSARSGKPVRCASGPSWAGGQVEDDDPGGAGRIILGAELAQRLHAKVGDCIQVLIPFSGEEIDAQPVAYEFAVVGLFRLGFHEYDTRLAYVSLEDARKMGGARPTLFGVELRFDDARHALKMEREVVTRLGYEPRIIDWETLNHNLFMALEMQKLIIALFLMIIIVVAAFNIIASLTMIVLSKVREMAILGAMGARKAAVMRLFVSAGSLVGFVGVGLGILYGVGVCALARVYGYPLDPKVYLIARLPVQITAGEILFVAVSTQLICMLATIYPALRASRMKVVDGLRYT